MRFLLCTLLASFSLIACGGRDDPDAPETALSEDGQPKSAVTPEDQTWLISSANHHATEAGARILREGGSAVDAAIAVQAVLTLVEPHASGLGGGGFMLFYEAQSGQMTTYDGRETAPFSADPSMFLTDTGERMDWREVLASGKAVGVPSVVAMLDRAHRDHGRIEWQLLFEDAITLSREGVEVSPRLAKLLIRSTPLLLQDETATSIFFDDTGEPLTTGAMYTNEPYAESLTAIAEGGAGAFYSGEIAQSIVDTVNARAGNGYMDLDDITSYEAVTRDPVCGDFLTYEICTMGPPSSALALIQMLGKLESHGLPPTPSGELWATYAEAGRLAYADRAEYLGDPTSMGAIDITPMELSEALVAPDYLARRAQLIGTSAAAEVVAGSPLAEKFDLAPDQSEDIPGTTHFTIRDKHGNVVSMTGTIEGSFGSHIMAGGMFLNNELTDFSWVPEIDGRPVVNAIGPGKKPRSSMSPVIVLDEDGKAILAIGSSGGSTIIGTVAKTLLLALGYDMPLQEAVNAPHITPTTKVILLEDSAPDHLESTLTAYGHEVRRREYASSLNGFRVRNDGQLEMAADARRESNWLTEE